MKPGRQRAHMLGLGLDREDDHIRITTGPNFTVLMGSEQTHEALREICIRVNEKLRKSGRDLASLSHSEFAELVREVQNR